MKRDMKIEEEKESATVVYDTSEDQVHLRLAKKASRGGGAGGSLHSCASTHAKHLKVTEGEDGGQQSHGEV